MRVENLASKLLNMNIYYIFYCNCTKKMSANLDSYSNYIIYKKNKIF